MQQQCVQCSGLYKRMQEDLHKKYYEQFNFYFAKPITEILANVPVDHVILFKDLLYLHDENEYLKRYYGKDELDQRIRLLSDIYTDHYQLPNLWKVQLYKVMEKRQKKQQKLMNRVEQQQQPITKQMIPDRIFSENYVEPSYSESYPQQHISYETSAHDIYQQNTTQQEGKSIIIGFQLQCCQLFDCNPNDQELEGMYNQVNAYTKSVLHNRSPCAQSTCRFRKQQIQNDSKKNIKVPPLKLQDSAHKPQSTTISSLMKKYDQILQKRFHVKEILTERNETKRKTPISDEMLIKIYKQHLSQMKKSKPPKSENYQFHACYKNIMPQQQQAQSCTFEKENEKKKKFTNKVYLPKPFTRKPPSQLSSPSTTNMQNTCSPSMLLRSLSNPSMAPSPARRLEIKVNLNKLIHQQEEEIIYLTQRQHD